MKSAVIALGVVAALSGCAAVGPAFSPVLDMKPGQGVLYVYRPETHAMSVLSAVFDIDGRKVTTLENNGYAAIPMLAGQHEIGHQWKAGLIGNSNLEGRPVFVTVKVTDGQATYVRLLAQARWGTAAAAYPNIGINTQFRWVLEEVQENVALPELQKTKGTAIEPQP